jgi:mRNA interferase MazF
MIKGDIILIPFPFTSLIGKKLRPSVILISGKLDLTVCFITTQLKWKEPTDVLLEPDKINGMKKPSIIRISKIITVDKSLAFGILGHLNNHKMEELNQNLKILLQLL